MKLDVCERSTHGQHGPVAVFGPRKDVQYFSCTYCGKESFLKLDWLMKLLRWKWDVRGESPIAAVVGSILGWKKPKGRRSSWQRRGHNRRKRTQAR